MARSRYNLTQAKFERYVKEGRGKGRGKDYKPWITIQDFPSVGRASRSPGWKSNRVHHLMSDWESRLFYLFEWSKKVQDIREQYPLLDLDLAMEIAKEMGIKYPVNKESNTPYVLTTDFMLTVKQGKKSVQIARTFKTTKDLGKKKTVEKLELERRYWQKHNIDWAIVTEQEISKIFASNIQWVHSDYHWKLSEEQNNENCYYLNNILKERLNNKKSKISTITTALDKDMSWEIGTSLSLFKHLVAKQEIIIDMFQSKIADRLAANIIKEII
ncbi:MAG: TnsA endonuclease N-terminal domain-containing protein [Xenococcaceae cyanobacterium MO_188.B29]|nr:TnsA endonuclease N-terminal domain-containing protein [Xenococcaceae cyanobacterium MO_188.B29]